MGYKKQIEEAEEIAALNLAKFRQAQANLGESHERADLNEQAVAKMKAKERLDQSVHLSNKTQNTNELFVLFMNISLTFNTFFPSSVILHLINIHFPYQVIFNIVFIILLPHIIFKHYCDYKWRH